MDAGPAGNRRTWRFLQLYDALPPEIRALADAAFATFERDPFHPALGRHELEASGRGRHEAGTFSVKVNQKYRALGVRRGDVNVWYWIGKHNDYENFIGRK